MPLFFLSGTDRRTGHSFVNENKISFKPVLFWKPLVTLGWDQQQSSGHPGAGSQVTHKRGGGGWGVIEESGGYKEAFDGGFRCHTSGGGVK